MRLRTQLLGYLIGLHLSFFGLALLLYRERPLMVVAIEVLLLLSLLLGVLLLRRLTLPLDYTRRFHDLLQDRNYAARLTVTADDEVAGIVRLFNGMLDQLCRERLQLGEQRGLMDQLLEATPSAVIVFDFEARISLLNASAQALLGIADPAGQALSHWIQGAGRFVDLLDADTRRHRLELIAQLEAVPLGAGVLLADSGGRRFRCQRGQFFDRGFARHFLLIEELTLELERSERDTYERLVRVLAHEVNNTVAATCSVLDSLLYYQPQLLDADRADFSTAIDAVKRRNMSLGECIERFSRVAKMPPPDLRAIDVRSVLGDILTLFREQCRLRGIQLDWLRCEAPPPFQLDRNLIEQALLNIVKNAMEAAEDGGRERPGQPAFVHLELVCEHASFRLSVIDSGNRLGEVPAGQMFTPFFTTKKGGQGIGLMFVREVLHRHGLRFRLAADGQGRTRFDVWFPAG